MTTGSVHNLEIANILFGNADEITWDRVMEKQSEG